MTVGCEDCGSLEADGTLDVAPVASAEICFCAAGAAAADAATTIATVQLPHSLGRAYDTHTHARARTHTHLHTD